MKTLPFESELVLATQIREGSTRIEQHARRAETRNAQGADWMVDEVHTKDIAGMYVGWPLCVTNY